MNMLAETDGKKMTALHWVHTFLLLPDLHLIILVYTRTGSKAEQEQRLQIWTMVNAIIQQNKRRPSLTFPFYVKVNSFEQSPTGRCVSFVIITDVIVTFFLLSMRPLLPITLDTSWPQILKDLLKLSNNSNVWLFIWNVQGEHRFKSSKISGWQEGQWAHTFLVKLKSNSNSSGKLIVLFQENWYFSSLIRNRIL